MARGNYTQGRELRQHVNIGDRVRNPEDYNDIGIVIDKADNSEFTTFLCSENGTVNKSEYRFGFTLHQNVGVIKIYNRPKVN